MGCHFNKSELEFQNTRITINPSYLTYYSLKSRKSGRDYQVSYICKLCWWKFDKKIVVKILKMKKDCPKCGVKLTKKCLHKIIESRYEQNEILNLPFI